MPGGGSSPDGSLDGVGTTSEESGAGIASREELYETGIDLASMKGWFTENTGQIDRPDIGFVYTGSECTIGFMESGYLMKLKDEANHTSIVQVRFQGSNPVTPVGADRLSHYSNYFIGDDPSNWMTGVANYGKIIYEDLYEGIDLVFTATETGLKYDFLVEPGGDPDDIGIVYDGAGDIEVDGHGDLLVSTGAGILKDERPYSGSSFC